MSSEERVFCGSSKCSSKTQQFHARLIKVLATMELLHCAVLLAVLVNGEIKQTNIKIKFATYSFYVFFKSVELLLYWNFAKFKPIRPCFKSYHVDSVRFEVCGKRPKLK